MVTKWRTLKSIWIKEKSNIFTDSDQNERVCVYKDFGTFILGEIKSPTDNWLGQSACGWVRDLITWYSKEPFYDPMNKRVSWHYSYKSGKWLYECGVQSDCFLVQKVSQMCWCLLEREENSKKKKKMCKEELRLWEFPREEYALKKYLHYSGCSSAGFV